MSPRSDRPIIVVNCGAIHENLLESELFGHEKGAFTGAVRRRIGYFEEADGGSLFLDELPSLSPALQAKVLTAIEDHRIRRVGGNRAIEVDVRLLAATSQDLKRLVAEKQFREDLFHRLDLVSGNPGAVQCDVLAGLRFMIAVARALPAWLSDCLLRPFPRPSTRAFPDVQP